MLVGTIRSVRRAGNVFNWVTPVLPRRTQVMAGEAHG
jgi:hypothetical protein